MRSVFLSLCLLGATCGGGEAPAPQPPSLSESDPGPDVEPMPEPGESDGQDAGEAEASEPEADDPKGSDKAGPDTGRVELLDSRLDQQLGEADNIIHVLRKDDSRKE